MQDKNEIEKLNQLKSAVQLSPDNLLLRAIYADALLSAGKSAEAEEEFRHLLKKEPENAELHYKLANLYYRQNKISKAVVLLEPFINRDNVPDNMLLLHINLLIKENDTRQAAKFYARLKQRNPELKDQYLENLLGAGFEDAGDEDDDEKDKVRLHSEETGPTDEDILLEKPDISFKDVGGMDSVKEDIAMKIIAPLKHKDLFKAYGKKTGGGILMFGPPGCGKTYIAKATAGEINASFIPVGLHDVLDMWLGQSEHHLHDVFEYARRNAPCVLFFDEVDAIGASRGDMKTSGTRGLINQFLMELDGVNTSNEGILILAATNAPWYLDTAFKRPGRFDKIVFVPPPDAGARKAILDIILKGKPTEQLDAEYIAKAANGFSGADLKALIETCVEDKLKEIIKSGIETPLSMKDIKKTIKAIKPSTKDWFETAKNYAIYSNRSGWYDDILKYLGIER